LWGCQSGNQNIGLLSTENLPSERKTQILSDNWRFQLDVRDIGEKEQWYTKDFNDWATVTVPRAWNCYEEALWQYEGIGWYATNINPEDFYPGGKTQIRFGRVMNYSKVWLNGEFIGENIGGYLPFGFDITKHLKPGQENRLMIRVDNRPNIKWLPASEQMEWIQYGGILEPVKLVNTAHTYIDDLIVRTTQDNKGAADISCMISIANETMEETELDLNISISLYSDMEDKRVKVLCKPNEKTKVNVDFTLKQAKLWSPDTPVLYTADISLLQNGSKIDDQAERFGIREVRVEGTNILLNGNPLIIKGTNRYDAYDRFGPNPPEKLLREELALMKSVGINTIRVHYPASPQVLSLLDEYGIMLFEEIPLNWWGLIWGGIPSIGGEAEQNLDILDQAKSALTEMVARDKNHPCIIIWSMANECATKNDVGITVMRELLRLAKALDPTRLVTFVAGGDPTGHLGFNEADIVCFNEYFICDHISQLDSAVYKRLSRELVSFRSNFPDKPILMTEFGRQGIKDIHGDVFYSEEFQAAYLENNWKALAENPSISGGILWTWADYFHELHFTMLTSYEFYGIIHANYGPFGVVTGDRKQKKSLETLARMYGGRVPTN
jgi:beta-glucuronidase